jgi:hypothetical protein
MAIGVLIAVGRSWGGKDRDTGSVVTSALFLARSPARNAFS